MIKAIIFDFDGVLVNTYENHYSIYERKYENMNRDIHKKLFDGNILELKDSLKIKDKELDGFKIAHEFLMRQSLNNKLKDLLEKLNKKYKLFIISSKKEYILSEFLEKENALNLFDSVLGAETHRKKDFKFNLIFEKFNLAKDDVIFVTDTLGDILEGNKVGVKTIAIDFGFHERSRLEKGSPWKIASNFKQVENFIEEA